MAPGVPLNEIWVEFPEQIVVVPEIVAVGNAFTVTVIESVSVLVHGFTPDDVTLTKVYVAFVVNKGVVMVFAPAESKTIDCEFPKLSR